MSEVAQPETVEQAVEQAQVAQVEIVEEIDPALLVSAASRGHDWATLPLPVPAAAQPTERISGSRASCMCSRCNEAGKMLEPVELPIGAGHCPCCGKKKWLQRIWTGKLYTGRGVAKFVDGLVEPQWQAQRDKKNAAEKVRTTYADGTPIPREAQAEVMPHAAPTAIAAQALGLPMGGGRPGVRHAYKGPDPVHTRAIGNIMSGFRQPVPIPVTRPER
jgi:hypothetical protein